MKPFPCQNCILFPICKMRFIKERQRKYETGITYLLDTCDLFFDYWILGDTKLVYKKVYKLFLNKELVTAVERKKLKIEKNTM